MSRPRLPIFMVPPHNRNQPRCAPAGTEASVMEAHEMRVLEEIGCPLPYNQQPAPDSQYKPRQPLR